MTQAYPPKMLANQFLHKIPAASFTRTRDKNLLVKNAVTILLVKELKICS